MPTESATPGLAGDLVRIHRVITRGLAIGLEKGHYFKQAGFSEISLQQGFCDYSRSLATVLSGHHQAEDVVAFPAFQKRLPQGPYEHLAAQHRQIEALLVSTHQAVNEMNETGGDGLDWLIDDLNRITEIWEPHIRMEESIFSQEALDEVMGQVEQENLDAQIGKFSSEHSMPPHLIVPFVLFNLNNEDRAIYLSHMPGNIMGDLVLKAWKEQWAPMKPFLLGQD